MYSQRAWLNSSESSSTDSVVAFDGITQRRNDSEPEREVFLEIASCHGKVSLHPMPGEDDQAFIVKMQTLIRVIREFTNHLELVEAIKKTTSDADES